MKTLRPYNQNERRVIRLQLLAHRLIDAPAERPCEHEVETLPGGREVTYSATSGSEGFRVQLSGVPLDTDIVFRELCRALGQPTRITSRLGYCSFSWPRQIWKDFLKRKRPHLATRLPDSEREERA